MLKHFLSVIMLLAVTTTALAERVDMKQAGAVTDGTTVNTRLINSTIERLAGEGGGTLFFPAGRYLTGPIRLKSNITLELEAGATLLFSTNIDDYLPFVEVRHEGVMMKSFCPLIYATDAENIKNQVLEKLGLNSEEQKEDTNYLDGIQGLLKTKDGQQLNLDNIGTTPLAEKVKTKACDLVLKQGLNFIS